MDFVVECLRNYYQTVEVTPPGVSQREFGFGWKDKIDYRHKSFLDGKALKEFFIKEVPLYASYSLARYEFPSARPMPKKKFIGADLVFDLDTSYENEKHDHNTLLCNYCLQRVAQDALRLKEEFLVKDFGFSEKDVMTVFSGQKGFHIHVRSNSVQQLSSNARKELLDYIAGNFDGKKMLAEGMETPDNSERRKSYSAAGPSKNSHGWAGKIYEETLKLFQNPEREKLLALGFTKKDAASIAKNPTDAVTQLENGKWDAFCTEPQKVFSNIAGSKKVATTVEIDKAVTFDIARLIRLPNSIHGSTGFAAKTLSDLANFDPTKTCTITPNATKQITTAEDVSIVFAGQTYEIKQHTQNEVPAALALFLACKKKTCQTGDGKK